VVDETIYLGKADEMMALHEGDIEAWRADIKGQQYEHEARLYELAAGQTSPAAAGLPSLISGVAGAVGTGAGMFGGGGGSGALSSKRPMPLPNATASYKVG